MRKPHYLNWDGVRVLALYDGMHETSVAAIQTMAFDELCLFAGDFPDLSAFEDAAGKIRRLSVSTAVGVMDFDSLKFLKDLPYLRLSDAIKSAVKGQSIDFSAFPKLETCSFSWKNYFTPSLLECESLRTLALWGCPAKDLRLLSNAPQITTLCLAQGSPVDLGGIERLQSLEKLDISLLRNLADISALGELKALRHLCISNCSKLEDLTPIHSLPMLEVLHVAGKHTFDDLQFLRNFPALQEFIFEIQLKNHDFAPLFDLPALRLGRFITLRDFVATPKLLQELARAKGRKLKLELIGGGKIKTVTFKL
ncbi:hypothetical protein SAMN05518865_12265 [Duganella sp. CF458]|uniref:leucine-rich repeat domain-containing protein n=1 Tax=Duganella sp. CF458 TaxID=1884368 RepID=UPI0008EB782C|nr:leucine-rich repeat domain-containing protein [Duganella sp. CF458]SFG91074.1 hypothetical protein SAMN05518865_12265 [Duganella sp. CF458]